MPRARILKTIFEKIDPQRIQRENRERKAKEKQLANQEKQRLEAEQRRLEKERIKLEEKRTLVQQKIREAVERGEITEAEAAMLPDLDENFLVTWTHIPYIDHVLRLRQQIENGEWAEVCLYLSDKKDYNPVFTETICKRFGPAYTFEEHTPHANPYARKKKRRKKNTTAEEAIEKETEETVEETVTETGTAENEPAPALTVEEKIRRGREGRPTPEPWTDNLYDACAPHLVVTYQTMDNELRFGIMTLWRSRFTKHGLSLMARSQFIKTKLFEQETGIPVFMVFGVGGTAETPERLFVLPFHDIENHFIPKPVAYRYELDPSQMLHYVPELGKLK